jgi:hypothetical protein
MVRRRTVKGANAIVKGIEASVVIFLGVDWFSPPAQSPLQKTSITNAVVPQVKDLSGRVGTITGIPATTYFYNDKSITAPAPIPTILRNINTPNEEGVQIIFRVVGVVPGGFFVRGPLDQFKECEEVVLCFISPGSLQLLNQGRGELNRRPQGLLNVCLDVQSATFRVFLVYVDRRHLI